MFAGTPCQCAALKAYLKKPYDNLTLIDFICHGVPSPLFLEKYKKWLEESYHEKIIDLNFRSKIKGWYDALRIIKTEKGIQYKLKGKEDCYWVAFNNKSNSLQNSCYDCSFLGFPHVSDITIADFWGIGRKIPFNAKNQIANGVSMIISNNEHGKIVINNNPYLEKYERTMEEAIDGNFSGVKSTKRPYSRDRFYDNLKKLPFNVFANRYLIPSKKTMLVKLWREYFPAYMVSGLRKILQK